MCPPTIRPSCMARWPAPAYPPTYWPPPPAYYPGAALASGFAWGLGIAAAGAIFSNCNWNNNDVNVNINKATNIDRNFDRTKVEGGKWQHDAGHRQGVAYRDNATRDKYSRGVQGADARRDYRGRTGATPERVSTADRSAARNQGAANRPGRANNANVANRAGANTAARAIARTRPIVRRRRAIERRRRIVRRRRAIVLRPPIGRLKCRIALNRPPAAAQRARRQAIEGHTPAARATPHFRASEAAVARRNAISTVDSRASSRRTSIVAAVAARVAVAVVAVAAVGAAADGDEESDHEKTIGDSRAPRRGRKHDDRRARARRHPGSGDERAEVLPDTRCSDERLRNRNRRQRRRRTQGFAGRRLSRRDSFGRRGSPEQVPDRVAGFPRDPDDRQRPRPNRRRQRWLDAAHPARENSSKAGNSTCAQAPTKCAFGRSDATSLP